MRLISTKIHGLLDYLVAAVLIASPWLLSPSVPGNASYVPVALGVAVILYSIFTNYESGLVKVFSMHVHLSFDLIIGVILACSPWFFGFSRSIYLPHLLTGLLIICVALTTNPATSKRRVGNLVRRGYGR